MTKYETNVWYGWNGGECPVHPETVVQVQTYGECPGSNEDNASTFTWHEPDINGNPIIAFRVVKEHKETREFWAFMMAGGYWIESVPEAEGAVLFREVLK